MAAVTLDNPRPLLAEELDGWVTINYLRSEEDGEVFTSAEQRVRLNWSTALSNSDLLNLYAQYSQEQQTNPDGKEFRPLVGFNLVGPEYHWMTEYREFIDRNLEGDDYKQTTRTLFSVLNLNYGPDYPDLTLDFSRTESSDDLEEPQTDFVETDYGLRATYASGPFYVSYSHRENIFDNNLDTLAPIELDAPIGAAVDDAGTIYVTDAQSDRVLRFSPSGAFLGEFGGFGSGTGLFRNPAGIAVGPGFIYVADEGNDRIQRFDSTGTFVSEWGIFGRGTGEFDEPYGIAVDPTGVYVSDRGNDRVQKFTLDGLFLFEMTGFNRPSGVASDGHVVFVADTNNHRIQVFSTEGAFITQWGSFGSAPGQFQFPIGVAVDSSDRVYVTDRDNNRVQVFTVTGAFLDTFGGAGSEAGQFQQPQGIAVTPANDVVIADTGNGRIEVLTNSGVFLFAIGEVSADERGISTELSLDTFSIMYSKEFLQGVYGSIDYDLFVSEEKNKETGDEIMSNTNHDINAQLRLLPYRWISLTSSYDFRFFSTSSGDVDTDRDELTQTYILALQPINRVNVSASYTRDDVETNVGPDEGSAFTTVSLNMFPTNRINVNLSYSDLQSEEDGKATTETDTFTAASNMKIYRGVDLNLLASSSKTQDFEADGEVDTQRVRGLLRLVPRPNIVMDAISEFSVSDSEFAGSEPIDSTNILNSLDVTWALSRRLSLFFDVDYIHSDSDGESREDVNYTSDLVWRMNEYLTFFIGHRGGTDQEEVFTARSQARFPFIWDTRMTIDYEIERGQESDSQFLFLELTKTF